MKAKLFFDLTDFGIMIRFFKNAKITKYKFSFDLQFLWWNLWIQIIKK